MKKGKKMRVCSSKRRSEGKSAADDIFFAAAHFEMTD